MYGLGALVAPNAFSRPRSPRTAFRVVVVGLALMSAACTGASTPTPAPDTSNSSIAPDPAPEETSQPTTPTNPPDS
jgi:hypothetical protein